MNAANRDDVRGDVGDRPRRPNPEQPHPAAQADAMGSTVLAYLLTGPAVFGGIGWGLDQWLQIRGLVGVGTVIGMGLSLYMIWFRYGKP